MDRPRILVIGTCDTKLEELTILKNKIASEAVLDVVLIDVGRQGSPKDDSKTIDVSQEEVLTHALEDLQNMQRGDVIKHMSHSALKLIKSRYTTKTQVQDLLPIHGIVSAGGSGGTSLASAVMRDTFFPLGFPKLIVSTVASGDTGPIVGETDITMMYSIVDIAGSNNMLQVVLDNAAGAIAGMSKRYHQRLQQKARTSESNRKRISIGITMFGVTTPSVDMIRKHLSKNPKYDFDIFVFHATGHGGLALERLVREGSLDAVIDLTTTEICDYIVPGGVMSAGPQRLEAPLEAGIPYIISTGACDMVNFGPIGTVPEQFRDGKRKLYEHNPTVTLMRTSKEECKQIGEFIAEKVSHFAKAPQMTKVILPKGGVSMIAIKDGPFYDNEADELLFSSIERGLERTGVDVTSDTHAINDRAFSERVANVMITLCDQHLQEF